jgi:hypothetical protein
MMLVLDERQMPHAGDPLQASVFLVATPYA